MTLITENRRTAFITSNRDAYDFTFLIMVLSPLAFFTSTITLWRSRHAIDNIVCTEDTIGPCESYSRIDIFKFNYLWWTIWFFIGLHFTYKDSEDFSSIFSFSFAFDEFETLTLASWMVIVALGVIAVGFMIFEIIKVVAMGMIRWYSCQFLLLIALFGFMILMFPNRTTHPHHWTMGLIISSFCSSPDLLTAAVHGLCIGLMVEGGAAWGYDFVWKLPEVLYGAIRRSIGLGDQKDKN